MFSLKCFDILDLKGFNINPLKSIPTIKAVVVSVNYRISPEHRYPFVPAVRGWRMGFIRDGWDLYYLGDFIILMILLMLMVTC